MTACRPVPKAVNILPMATQSFPPAFHPEPIPILITRPENRASRLVAELQARFGGRLDPVVSPLIRIAFVDPALPSGYFAALILTSESGAQGAARLEQQGCTLPALAYCVGDRTSAEAEALGFRTLSARGDAGDLVRLIRDEAPMGALLYLHGHHRAADLACLLPGHDITSVIVYTQKPCPLGPEARQLLSRRIPVIVPLFSPRSARLFAAAVESPRARILPVAISRNTCDALPPALAAHCLIADRPDADAMLQAIGHMIETLDSGQYIKAGPT